MAQIELGLDTFGDVTIDGAGQLLPQPMVIRNVVEEAVLADDIGLDFFGVGEHHREDFAVSAPDVVLAAIAARTRRIRLGSAVTVLSSDGPGARVPAVRHPRGPLGRPRRGDARPGLLHRVVPAVRLRPRRLRGAVRREARPVRRAAHEEPVTWSGATRAPLQDQRVYPTTGSGSSLRTWVGVGGSPESVVRAARHGLPLMLAIIGGEPLRFSPLADLYRRALAHLGRPPLPIGIHSPGHVAETDERARDELWPHYRVMHARIGRERGWPPMTREQFDVAAGPSGALAVGAPTPWRRRSCAPPPSWGRPASTSSTAPGRSPTS